MDYISRYGLEYNPYLKNNKETLIETTQYREVNERLNYLLQAKGFGLLTGQAGMGKTTSIRNWTKSLNSAAYKIIYIAISTLTVMEFYRALSVELGYEAAHKKYDNFKNIQRGIERYVVEKRMIPIFIIDEANYLKNGTLNDLKIIFNFDMDSINKAVILLVGLPQLNSILDLNVHEPLKQRIIMNYEMTPLSNEESKQYIIGKLREAGSHMEVFDKNALESIVGCANGIPRIIDKIVNRALMIGNDLNQNIITSDTIMKTIEDIQV